MTATQTRAQLEAQLAAIDAAETAETARRAAVLDDARKAYNTKLHRNGRTIEDQFIKAGRDALEAAREALARFDLNEGYRQWATYVAARSAQAQARSRSQQAAASLNVEPWTRADLNPWAAVTWSDFLTNNSEAATRILADTMLADTLDEPPTDYDTAAAYLADGNQ